MPLTNTFDIVFAAGVGVAAFALVGAAMRFLPRLALVALTSLELGAAIGAWLFFALRHSHPRELAVAAGGLTGRPLAGRGAVALPPTPFPPGQKGGPPDQAQAGPGGPLEPEARGRAPGGRRRTARPARR